MGKCRATKAQVEKFMKWAEKEEMIASTRTTRGRIRFIVNYARFQDLSFYKEDLKKTTEKTSGRVAEELEKVPIDKNVKNERMKEEKYMSEKEFEEFWKRYPRKENKKKAREKFLKLPLKDFSKIKEGLSRALASRQWKIDGIIPHPTTWINGERWNDEAEEAPEEQKGICF
ncbi:MAG: hypothetical protein GWP15_03110 [Nitrospirae bacterium]|nr:hypothetical protein [Nitrospirota bacterium]